MTAGACEAPIAVVPLGVDARCFPLVTRADGPPWRLLRVACLNAVKDHATLLDALARLVHTGLALHLDIVGEDTMNGRIQTLTRALGLESHVTFHGFQPTDRLPAYYARAHLHVVSSRHEAAAMVVLEAAASGVATVGTAVGYVADWDPDRAVAVPVQNAEALANAIAGLLQDPPRRAGLASAAREWTLRHDADWTAAQFEEIYSEVARRAV